jgi:hypothetical protein
MPAPSSTGLAPIVRGPGPPMRGISDIIELGVRPGREWVFQMAKDAFRDSPYAVTRSEANRGRFIRSEDCCPCPPGGQQGQQAPSGLQQPALPQKPFQSAGQDPCSYVDEVLAGIGLSRDLLAQCGCCTTGRKGASNGGMTFRGPLRRKRSSRTRITPKQFARRVGIGSRSRKNLAETEGESRSGRGSRLRKPGVTMSSSPYRVLSNGACWDARTKRMSKGTNCYNFHSK